MTTRQNNNNNNSNEMLNLFHPNGKRIISNRQTVHNCLFMYIFQMHGVCLVGFFSSVFLCVALYAFQMIWPSTWSQNNQCISFFCSCKRCVVLVLMFWPQVSGISLELMVSKRYSESTPHHVAESVGKYNYFNFLFTIYRNAIISKHLFGSTAAANV